MSGATRHDHDHDHHHDHGHSHGHGDHHDHHHHDHLTADKSRILYTFWLIAIFLIVEATGGWWTGSLALLADAGHMLTDAAALGLAWFAARANLRPADAADRSYGHDRFSVLAALVNGLGLVAISLWIAGEAVGRLIAPEPVKALPMLVIAALGFAVNTGAFFLLHGADRGNLNINAAILHVLGDMLASLAAVAAAIIIMTTGWTFADPILSVVAGALILRNAFALVRRSWRVLMEATPEDLDVSLITKTLEGIDGVADIHHLHAWSLTPGKKLITLHARVAGDSVPDQVLTRIKVTLSTRFNIDHSTIQMETLCPDDETHRDGYATLAAAR